VFFLFVSKALFAGYKFQAIHRGKLAEHFDVLTGLQAMLFILGLASIKWKCLSEDKNEITHFFDNNGEPVMKLSERSKSRIVDESLCCCTIMKFGGHQW
jgi:hypothetical protein